MRVAVWMNAQERHCSADKRTNEMRSLAWIGLLAAGSLILLGVDVALADQPRPWQFGFQEPVTEVMREINSFHNMLLVIIATISALVLGLLLYVMVRFNARANPTPSKVSHNTLVEVLWTVVPILILVVIAIPSFRLLYFIDTVPEADITLKATGYQWNWGYEYPDIFGDEEFIANMVPEEELGTDAFGNPQPRLLAADFDIVVPVGKTVRVIVTAGDVLHAWAMPAFGIKMDAVPGRLNETWFKVEKEGMYYGQCSELCGIKHAFMPIAVAVVSQERFDEWVIEVRDEYGIAASPSQPTLAMAQNNASKD